MKGDERPFALMSAQDAGLDQLLNAGPDSEDGDTKALGKLGLRRDPIAGLLFAACQALHDLALHFLVEWRTTFQNRTV